MRVGVTKKIKWHFDVLQQKKGNTINSTNNIWGTSKTSSIQYIFGLMLSDRSFNLVAGLNSSLGDGKRVSALLKVTHKLGSEVSRSTEHQKLDTGHVDAQRRPNQSSVPEKKKKKRETDWPAAGLGSVVSGTAI
jgi:hypothetical protein